MNRETLSKQISCLLNIAYVPKLEDYLIHPQINIITKHKLWALNAINASIREPKLSQWDYLGKNDVEVFLKLSEYKAIQKFIGCTLKQNVKVPSK
ncbi:uncharacterized protein LOC132696135 isoform X2 [Cylas formicarius]|uniref:uncharacterized protein LOC132696135 isoform X2 n=1 Tax=Cylas formicarius TaxID=197179 RepID=UPI0029586405|nr:uncharacterized protein LOC132696135 isoform X2 [Cylas formicarius]